MEHHHQLQSKRQKTHHDDDSRVHGFSTAIDPVDDFQYENSIQETNLIGSSSFLYPGNFHGQVEEYEQARIDENFVEIIESNREECPILSLDSGLEQQHQFSVMRDHFEAFVEIGQNMMKQLGATATGKAVMDRNQDSQVKIFQAFGTYAKRALIFNQPPPSPLTKISSLLPTSIRTKKHSSKSCKRLKRA